MPISPDSININGNYFPIRLFSQLLTYFKAGFAETSLTIERESDNLRNARAKLNKNKNEKAYAYFNTLDENARRCIEADLRRFIVFIASCNAVIKCGFNPSAPQDEVDRIYEENSSLFEPIDDLAPYFIVFDENGCFSQKKSFNSIREFFRLYFEVKNAENRAKALMIDHLRAFDYAMALENIGAAEIIEINSIVNDSDPNKEEGFKKVNNTIRSASFIVSDKKQVPFELQKLLAEYKTDFGLIIEDFTDKTISAEEENNRLLNIFLREAIFHIRFERLHPFADGNGRTGRIIMNKHLIDCGVAPVLITERDKYINYINDNNYKGLAQLLMDCSYQTFYNWLSILWVGLQDYDVTNYDLANSLLCGEEPKGNSEGSAKR